ncbi:MAG TPA: MBL fold metallo-hydrolase [Bryobacteraceae bacterium]|nr:MBL fold metallo-hydrolase [Bryobacteraceae bacterium]
MTSGTLSADVALGDPSINIQIIPVTAGIWCFRRPSYFACSYLVSEGDRVIAVDVGMDSQAKDFLEGLHAVGMRPDQLKLILLTHWHNDHCAGAAFLQRNFGVPVYYGAGDTPFLTRKTANRGLRGRLGKHVPEEGVLVLLRGLLEEAAPEAVVADHLVSDGESIAGVFRALATPGHTGGHVAYLHEPTHALFCGDALAVVNSRLRLMARPVTPDLIAARASALRCLQEEPRIICPGHRAPLVEGVRRECSRLRDDLESGKRWPWLG